MLELPNDFKIRKLEYPEFVRNQLKWVVQNRDSDRTLSKPVTFALQYFAQYTTLVRNSGFSVVEAKAIEDNYHTLYKQSTEYKKARIEEASKQGYITVAFGLRVRTPLLGSTLLGSKATPYEAEAEGRTAGNAMFQSYCMLNQRAVGEFLQKVRADAYSKNILPVASIHDASYYLIKADPEVLKYVNDHLVEASFWQDLPEIQHPEVTLGGTLGVFYPSWEYEYPVENGASLEDIIKLGEDIANV